MTVSRLTCPECGTVLRPGKPLPAGKKVKCPRCENVFTARAEREEEEAPRPKAAGRKHAAEPARKAEDEEGGVYGYVKDETEEDEEKKPQINYAPDMSIKDLRGPAQSMVMSPTNKLALCGFIGFFGWLVLLILLMIPALLPIKEDTTKKEEVKSGAPGGGGGGGTGQPAPKKEKPGFFRIATIDLSFFFKLAWHLFLASLIPILLCMFYSALVAYGAIQMQNLESRGWGIASSIMAMIPLHSGGLQLVTGMVVQFFLGLIIDDVEFISVVALVVVTVEWLLCVAVGAWTLKTAMNEDVIAGFEYQPE
jgi:predicted Zn finger-like uncharacterized protein